MGVEGGVLLVLFPGFLLTALLARSSAVWGLALIVPSAAAIWLGSWGLLAYRQIFLSPLLPVVTLAVVFTVLTTMRFLRADRQVASAPGNWRSHRTPSSRVWPP